MKTVCVYHSVDLDGWMSAAIVKHWFITTNKSYNITDISNQKELIEKEKVSIGVGVIDFSSDNKIEFLDFIAYNYGQPIPDLSEYDKVIMVDISFPKDEMKRISLESHLIYIDHHISAINDVRSLISENIRLDGLTDTKYAACELTWKYFIQGIHGDPDKESVNNPMPEIVRLLGRYDCFGYKRTDEEQKVLEFQYGARQIISNYEEAYEYLQKSLNNYPISIEIVILEQGKSIYQYLYTEAKQTYKNGFEIKLWQDAIPTDSEIRPIPAIGDCDICGKRDNMTRYYFRYENDKCNCHSPYHFDLFDCCSDCKPTAKNKVPKRFICINKERFNPINFGIDYHKDGYDGCACFHYDGVRKVWAFSLYNDNGLVDCSQIAKQFGGGGHKGAAGFVVDNLNKVFYK